MPEAIARLQDRTEGWIAGLQWQACPCGTRPINRIHRSVRWEPLARRDYLAEQVLLKQPPDQDFYCKHRSWSA
jgi:ATP/maltotriose-dependent transcriptional regulator MalT